MTIFQLQALWLHLWVKKNQRRHKRHFLEKENRLTLQFLRTFLTLGVMVLGVKNHCSGGIWTLRVRKHRLCLMVAMTPSLASLAIGNDA